jgi:hypothetical protein
VLDAVAVEHLQGAVVASQRHRHLERAAGRGEHLVHAVVEAEVADGVGELVQCAVERGTSGRSRSRLLVLDPARSPLTAHGRAEGATREGLRAAKGSLT